MSKILVTGGAGYIGSHTVHLLRKQGHEVVVIDNLSRGHRHNVERGEFHQISLQDTDSLTRVFEAGRFDAVVHFAAYIAVGESTKDPSLYFDNNVSGSISLFRAMERGGVDKLVFSSTAAVYGTPEEVPIREDQPYAPLSPYGESKIIVEKILGWLDQFKGVRSICLRYFNACGAEPGSGLGEQHEPETHLIPLLFQAIDTGKPVTIFGDDYPTPTEPASVTTSTSAISPRPTSPRSSGCRTVVLPANSMWVQESASPSWKSCRLCATSRERKYPTR